MFTIKNARGYVEVYNSNGEFCFSADSVAEANSELLEWYE